MAEILTLVSVFAMAGGQNEQAAVQEGEALQAQANANYQAALAERKGKEEFAMAQREKLAIKKERDRILGRNTAVAADSGLGSLDETVLALNADVIEESSLREDNAMYQGTSAKAGYYEQAAATRVDGQLAYQGGKAAADATRSQSQMTILGGVTKFTKSLAGGFTGGGSTGGNLRYG